MGFGLRAKEEIREGSLVLEYIGEVIDTAEMRRRMENQRKFAPNDHDFYIMELDGGVYVDGKNAGKYLLLRAKQNVFFSFSLLLIFLALFIIPPKRQRLKIHQSLV